MIVDISRREWFTVEFIKHSVHEPSESWKFNNFEMFFLCQKEGLRFAKKKLANWLSAPIHVRYAYTALCAF